LVTVFPQRGIEQGEHICAIVFNARNLLLYSIVWNDNISE
jgi:hypothetical protein